GDVGDALDLDQAVGLQGRAGLHEIDDLAAQADGGRQLHRAVELDALGLDAARGEVPAGDLRIFGGDADMAPARRIVLAGILGRRRHDQSAMPDLEVKRRVNLRVLELHQHVVAGDPDMRGAEGDEGRHVEIAHADDVEAGMAGGEAELARIGIVESVLDLDPGAPHHGKHFAQDTPLGQRQNQLLVTAHRHALLKKSGPRPSRVGQGSPRSSRWHRICSTSSRMLPPPAKSRKSDPASARIASSTISRSLSWGEKPRRCTDLTVSKRRPANCRSALRRASAGGGSRRKRLATSTKRVSSGKKAISPTATSASWRMAEMT